MKIGTKLILFLTIPLIALMVLFGYLSQRASRERLHDEMMREGRGIALTARVALEDYLRDRQIEDIRELVEKMSGYERVLGIRIFEPDGKLGVQSRSLNAYPFHQQSELADILRTRVPLETRGILGGEPVVSFLFPLTGSSGTILGAAQLIQLESYIREESRANRNFLAALTTAMILAAGAIVLGVTRWSVSRPIEELVRSFREVGTGEAVSRLAVRRRDEFGRLAGEFNVMCQRLEMARASLEAEQAERQRVESRLRNAERLASIGRLSAGLAHEIGTPLNVIGGRAEALRRKLQGNDVADKNLTIIVTQIERIARIVRGMLDFARARESHRSPNQVIPVLRRVLEFLSERMEEAGVKLEASLPIEPILVSSDPDQIYEVFLNLATNALDAMPRGGTLKVSARALVGAPPQRLAAAGPVLTISLEDSGVGIPRENMDRIFDPFFTTKDVGKGTGLGLSITYGIVQEHGGWIEVSSGAGGGACVTVFLPVQQVAFDGTGLAMRGTA
jgi:two-component system, NtrC family, sensor kinase